MSHAPSITQIIKWTDHKHIACRNCGKRFQRKTWFHVYCSQDCRLIGWVKRRMKLVAILLCIGLIGCVSSTWQARQDLNATIAQAQADDAANEQAYARQQQSLVVSYQNYCATLENRAANGEFTDAEVASLEYAAYQELIQAQQRHMALYAEYQRQRQATWARLQTADIWQTLQERTASAW